MGAMGFFSAQIDAILGIIATLHLGNLTSDDLVNEQYGMEGTTFMRIRASLYVFIMSKFDGLRFATSALFVIFRPKVRAWKTPGHTGCNDML